MIRIEIRSKSGRHIQGTSKRTGKDYSFWAQPAWAFTHDRDGKPNPYPQQFDVVVDSEANLHEPGAYTLAPNSIWIDRNGALTLTPRLVPVAPATKAA